TTTNPSVVGQNVTFTATVAAVSPGFGTPTGTVSFFVDGAAQGSDTLSGGQAHIMLNTLALGTRQITAVYSADLNFSGSDNTASPFSQVVNKASTQVALTGSATPITYGNDIVVTATVSAAPPG